MGTFPRSSLVRAAVIATAVPAERMVQYIPGDAFATPVSDTPASGCAFGTVDVFPILYGSSWMGGSVAIDTLPVYATCFNASASQVTIAASWNEPSAVPGSLSPVLQTIAIWLGVAQNTTTPEPVIDAHGKQTHRRVILKGLTVG